MKQPFMRIASTRAVIVAAAACAVALLAACPDSGAAVVSPEPTAVPVTAVKVTGVSLDAADVSLYTHETRALVATVMPADAADKSLTWSSDDAEVAAVDGNGKVTANSAGTATISAASAGGSFVARCTVTVASHVYVVAGSRAAAGRLPGYFKDGIWVDLPLPENSSEAEITALAVQDRKVYAGGYYMYGDHQYGPVIWKDGAAEKLPFLASDREARVTAIMLVDGAVHAGGYALDADNAMFAGCWVDGEWKALSTTARTGGTASLVYALVARGGMAYAAGLDNSVPGYWADGAFTSLGAEYSGTPYCAAFGGATLLLGGRGAPRNERYFPCVWSNGSKIDLPVMGDRTGEVTSLAFAKGKTYATGAYETGEEEEVAYWVDGVLSLPGQPFSDWTGSASAIARVGASLLLAGSFRGDDGNWHCCLWKDGEWSELAYPEGVTARSVYSIVVD